MKYHFKIHKEGTGFWAECLELDGCQTQGDSREHLQLMMEDVLIAFLNQKLESGKTANPEPATLAKLKTVFPDLSVDAVLY